jgi:hypothetical protein
VKRVLASPATRLRAGIVLCAVSWMPIAALLGASTTLRLVIWTAQILVGMAGVALAGSTFVAAVKRVGWRKAPRILWRGLIHGDGAAGASASA